ncbi:MAG TPA: RNA polymerase sporulation sigma factor SigH [Eubacteriaceae bacterium]|nr:RNA polymerase sporulation sigma factor SigH [Eubacteriaceae bacterium]
MSKDFCELSDECLVELAQNGDRNAERVLIERCEKQIFYKSTKYFLVGADREDLLQEGRIAAYRAIHGYVPTKGATFKSFSDMCIQSGMIASVKKANRQKHQPLNNYIPFESNRKGDEEVRVIDVLKVGESMQPEYVVIHKEMCGSIDEIVEANFSRFEKRVWDLYRRGESYRVIGDRLGRDWKAIDNAIQRIKKKIELHLIN